MSPSFIFFFGRTPQLSLLELSTVFPSLRHLGDVGALVEAAMSPVEMMSRLGGTVKIAKVVGSVSSVTPRSITPFLSKEKKSNHMVFGVSRYDCPDAVDRQFLGTMKTILEEQGIRGRFIEAREATLSSVVVSKQDVVELTIVKQEDTFLIGRTLVVQPFEEWNKRDYGRPFADPKSGMLPPKVARMAVNIASSGQTPLLLDPFCGMGTIVAEALLTGWRVIGCDQSAEVIEKAECNIRWLGSQYPSIDSSLAFIIGDATHISDKITDEKIDSIVTEPFMGSSDIGKQKVDNRNTKKVQNIMKGLEKLYIGCLKDWHKVLKPGGKVVIALPEYHVGGKVYFVKKVIDSCESLGYTQLAGPIEYSRPQAVVRREFFVFQKK